MIAGDVPIAIMSGTAAVSSQLRERTSIMAASTKKDRPRPFWSPQREFHSRLSSRVKSSRSAASALHRILFSG